MNYIRISIFLISCILIINCSIEENYTVIETEKPVITSKSLGSWISSIETDSRNNLWLGVEDPGTVYKSNNYNYKWLKTSLNNYMVDDIIISKDDVLFVTPYYTNLSSDSLILRSNDMGETWIPIGLNEVRLISLMITQNNLLMAGANGAIYFSSNEGIDWIKMPVPLFDNENIWVNNVAKGLNSDIWIELKGGISSKLIRLNSETNEYINYGYLSHINKIIVHENGDVFIAHKAHDEASGSVSRILTEIDTLEWFPMPYIDWFQIYVSDIDFYNNGLLAATSEGLKFSNDKGETWASVFIDSFFTAITVDNNNIIYAGTVNGYVIKIAEIEKLIGL